MASQATILRLVSSVRGHYKVRMDPTPSLSSPTSAVSMRALIAATSSLILIVRHLLHKSGNQRRRFQERILTSDHQ